MSLDKRGRALSAASLLLVASAQAYAGTITCGDQVRALRARLVGRPNETVRDQLKEAERLCREGKDGEALELIRHAHAAIDKRAAEIGQMMVAPVARYPEP